MSSGILKMLGRVIGEEISIFWLPAKVIKTDLLANNGVIHVIDTVILPRS